MKRFAVPALLVALVAAAGVWMFTGGDDSKKLVAHFPRAISVYEGSDVRVLGVADRQGRQDHPVRHGRRRRDEL